MHVDADEDKAKAHGTVLDREHMTRLQTEITEQLMPSTEQMIKKKCYCGL